MALPYVNYTGSDSPIRSRHHSVTHNWTITINPTKWTEPGLKDLMTAFTDANKNENNNGVSLLEAFCTQVSIPNTNVSTVEGNIRGVHFHQIQTRASTPIQTSMVFYEPHNYKLYRFFELWKSLTVNRYDGSQNPAARISNGVSISLWTSDRKYKVLEYPLYETFCTSAQISDPQNSGALQQLSVTLQSSNYGIIVPSLEEANADPIYKAINPVYATEANLGYLGTADNWISADGEARLIEKS